MKYVGAFVRHPHSRLCECCHPHLSLFICTISFHVLFCFYEHKDKFTRSGDVAETAQVDLPALGISPFMRFYLFIYSNKLQCQLNHRTLLVCCFSLSALFAVCYGPAPPCLHSLTSSFPASVGKLIFRLYRKSLFLFALECVVPPYRHPIKQLN